MDSYCIIPARAGSKRIKNKNLHILNGKPLIAYSIQAALESNIFSSVIVSTDSEEIAKVSRQYGAIVPRLREPKLSDDFIGTRPVIQDSINMLEIKNLDQTIIMCLYATAILINSNHIKLGIEKFLSENNHYPLLTLTRFTHPIERAYCKTNNHYFPLMPNNMNIRTQDFESKWFDAGQFYIAKAEEWLTGQEFKGPYTALILSPDEVVDIDTYEDLERASKKIVSK